jgi:hypothetical protein
MRLDQQRGEHARPPRAARDGGRLPRGREKPIATTLEDADAWNVMADEPDYQALCEREQAFLLEAIREDPDLAEETNAAVTSLRIVLAADESIRTGCRRAVDGSPAIAQDMGVR